MTQDEKEAILIGIDKNLKEQEQKTKMLIEKIESRDNLLIALTKEIALIKRQINREFNNIFKEFEYIYKEFDYLKQKIKENNAKLTLIQQTLETYNSRLNKIEKNKNKM